MMGYQDGQMEMVMMDIGELIPENHLLKRIEKHMSFRFVYELMESYYSRRGHPSIDPVSVIKMMLTVHAQESKTASREKAKSEALALRDMKLDKAAKKAEHSIEETLIYDDFPFEYWTRIRHQ